MVTITSTIFSWAELSKHDLTSATPIAVIIPYFLEIGPLIIIYMCTGTIGASMCAEIFNLKKQDHLDYMITLNVPTIHQTVIPNVISMLINLPVLSCIFVFVTFCTSLTTTSLIFGLDTAIFLENIKTGLKLYVIFTPIIKSIINSIIISTICTYVGYSSKKHLNISLVTNKAVIYSFISCLFTNIIITYTIVKFFSGEII